MMLALERQQYHFPLWHHSMQWAESDIIREIHKGFSNTTTSHYRN